MLSRTPVSALGSIGGGGSIQPVKEVLWIGRHHSDVAEGSLGTDAMALSMACIVSLRSCSSSVSGLNSAGASAAILRADREPHRIAGAGQLPS